MKHARPSAIAVMLAEQESAAISGKDRHGQRDGKVGEQVERAIHLLACELFDGAGIRPQNQDPKDIVDREGGVVLYW